MKEFYGLEFTFNKKKYIFIKKYYKFFINILLFFIYTILFFNHNQKLNKIVAISYGNDLYRSQLLIMVPMIQIKHLKKEIKKYYQEKEEMDIGFGNLILF